jgi:hypothetical protein
MTGGGLWNFLIQIVALVVVGVLFFLGIDYISKDVRFTKIAKWAVGGIITIILLVAIGGMLFGGGGGGALAVTTSGVIAFAIAIIVALIFLAIVDYAVNVLVPDQLKQPVLFIISGIVLIALLMVAGTVLTGGNLGTFNSLVGGKR